LLGGKIIAARNAHGSFSPEVWLVLARDRLVPKILFYARLIVCWGKKMAVCPKCGSRLQARKLLRLTNLNTIRCQVCSSKLRIKNKDTNSIIGGTLGGLGASLGILLFMFYFWTGNTVYLGLNALWLAGLFALTWLLAIKFVKVKLDENPNQQHRQQPH
jgi:DNA-directed RNA polymerase subunit RPC12/RpoP